MNRGAIYSLLTARPDNRRPLTWERNQIDILMMEGAAFTCPWTERRLTQGIAYDLDHILPIAVYPTNELWNLVPSDPKFNSHQKRDLLPTAKRLAIARPHLGALCISPRKGKFHFGTIKTHVENSCVSYRVKPFIPADLGFI